MDQLDKFYALSAPIRRDIIAILSDGDQLTATAISEKFQVTPSAISQHLKVLLSSSLLQMHKKAQQRIYQLNPAAILELETWASQISEQLGKVSNIVDSQIGATAPKEENQ